MARRKIRVMSDEMSRKIAAGEVVERPASIVKELLENSLDAGADEVVIELGHGGKEYIRVTDNGEGISRDDIPVAFERHATSKIYTFDELYGVRSFGFRGEALPSIAAVSKIEVLTRTEVDVAGSRVQIVRGEMGEIMDAGCPRGTSMRISELFYTTPVRKKFLKAEATEQAHCMDVVTRLAIANPGVRLKVISGGRRILDLQRSKGVEDRIAQVVGPDAVKNFREFRDDSGGVLIYGMASSPVLTRSNTKSIFCYVNGRYVKDSLIQHAVLAPYRRVIEARRYPSVIMFIELNPSEIDVNVHPTKIEVRFARSRDIYSRIVNVLASVLVEGPSSGLEFGDNKETVRGSLKDNYASRIEDAVKRYNISLRSSQGQSRGGIFPKGAGRRVEKETAVLPGPSHNVEGGFFSSFEYTGQIEGTYLLLTDGGSLMIIDQHAAHERIVYERLKKREETGKEEIQELLMPEVISLSPSQLDLVKVFKDMLVNMGFDVELFGEREIAVKSVPALLKGVSAGRLLPDIIEELANAEKEESISMIKEKIYALMACKAAVKGHQILSHDEVRRLCEDLDSTPFPSSCPHGRPVYVRFEKGDFEKWFKRR